MEQNEKPLVWWKWLLVFMAKSDNFKDLLAIILVFGYFVQLLLKFSITNEYMILLGMAIGNYFKHGSDPKSVKH